MQHPGIFKIGVINGLAPVGGFAAFEQGAQALALHAIGNFDPCKIEDRRREIHVHHQRVCHMPANAGVWIPHHQRNADGRFVHKPLVVPTVIAQKIPVVRRVNHQRIARLIRFVQIVEHAPQVFIYPANRAVPILHEPLIDPVLLLPRIQSLGQVVVILGKADVELHILGQRCNFARGKIILVRLGHGNLDIAKEVRVSGRGRKWPVRRLELIHQAKGLVPIQFPQEREGHIRGYICGVALLFHLFAIVDIRGVKIHALAGVDTPRIESAGILPNVVLAKQCGAIAGGAQQFGKGRHVGIQMLDGVGAFRIAPNAVDVRKASGQHGAAGGRAQGVGRKTVVEPRALVADAVEVGRLQDRIAVAAHFVRGVVIGHDEQDIGSLHFFSFVDSVVAIRLN